MRDLEKEIGSLLANAALLAHPSLSAQIALTTDASLTTDALVGAMLGHGDMLWCLPAAGLFQPYLAAISDFTTDIQPWLTICPAHWFRLFMSAQTILLWLLTSVVNRTSFT